MGVLFAARIVFGIAYGFIFSVLPMYLGEISSDKVRGYVTTWMVVKGQLGLLFTYSIGPYVSISTMAWLGLITPTLFIVTFIWLPETPYYLLGKNNEAAARHSLERLRGHTNIDAELNRMRAAVKESQENRGTFKELLAKENRRGLIIIFGLAVVQFLSGSSVIMDYSQVIFAKIQSNLEAHEISIVQFHL